MVTDPHLVLHELTLRPSGEWTPSGTGWVMVRVAEGVGYWLQDADARELNVGDGMIAGFPAKAGLRASQLGLLKLQFFKVQPLYLKGILTVTEWHQLEFAPPSAADRIIFFGANDLLGQKFSRTVSQTQTEGLSRRCALLQLWTSAVAGLVGAPAATRAKTRLREQVWQLLSHMPEAELSEHSLSDLAAQLNCSRRHFSRVFYQEFGVQFGVRFQRINRLPPWSGSPADTLPAAPQLRNGAQDAAHFELTAKPNVTATHGLLQPPID